MSTNDPNRCVRCDTQQEGPALLWPAPFRLAPRAVAAAGINSGLQSAWQRVVVSPLCKHARGFAGPCLMATLLSGTLAISGCASSPSAKAGLGSGSQQAASDADAPTSLATVDTRGLDDLDMSDADKAIWTRFLGKRVVMQRAAQGADEARDSSGGSLSVSGVLGGALRSRADSSPTISGLVVWFNEIPDLKENPYDSTARKQIAAALAGELPFSSALFNPVIARALKASGIINRSSLQSLDVDAFVQGANLLSQGRNLVNEAVLKLGYSGILAQVDNPWTALQVRVDGTALANLEPSPAPMWRRFLVLLAGEADANRFVDLSIDTPRDQRGGPAVRFNESIELHRYETIQVTLVPSAVPALSIAMRAANSTGTAVVLAGDAVTLTVESPLESALSDIVWIELTMPGSEQINAETILQPPSGSNAITGLLAWAKLRDMVVTHDAASRGTSEQQRQGGLLAGGTLNERVIGTGPSIIWRPKHESLNARVVVLARNQAGLWGLATRKAPVMDLRPCLWPRPLTHIDFTSHGLRQMMLPPWKKIGDVAEVDQILSKLQFIGTVGERVPIGIRSTPYSEAHVPPRAVTIDFGDGHTEAVDLEHIPVVLSHAYQQPGVYAVAVTATGLDGLQRTMTAGLKIEPRPVMAEVTPEPDVPNEAAMEPQDDGEGLIVEARTAAELFNQVARKWGRQIALATASEHNQIELAHGHPTLQRPLVDLLDEVLVEAFLEHGAQVFERDALWSALIPSVGALGLDEKVDAPSLNSWKVWLSGIATNLDEEIEPPSLGWREAWLSAVAINLDEKLNPVVMPLAGTDLARTVVGYKLVQANVTMHPIGLDLSVRVAAIRAYVRIHNRTTGEIVFAREVSTRLSDLVFYRQDVQASHGLDDQPSDWMVMPDQLNLWSTPKSDGFLQGQP